MSPSRAVPTVAGSALLAGLVLTACANGSTGQTGGSGSSTSHGVTSTVAPGGTEVRGVVRVGPMCPAQPLDGSCPDRPVPGAAVAWSPVAGGSAGAAARAVTASDGTFAVVVGPGTYRVQVTTAAARSCPSTTVTVEPAPPAPVVVVCDSGIR